MEKVTHRKFKYHREQRLDTQKLDNLDSYSQLLAILDREAYERGKKIEEVTPLGDPRDIIEYFSFNKNQGYPHLELAQNMSMLLTKKW